MQVQCGNREGVGRYTLDFFRGTCSRKAEKVRKTRYERFWRKFEETSWLRVRLEEREGGERERE